MGSHPPPSLGSRRDISVNICGLLPHQRWCELSKWWAGKGTALVYLCLSCSLSGTCLSSGSKLFLCSLLPEAFQGQPLCGEVYGVQSRCWTGGWAWLILGFRITGPIAAALLGPIPQPHLDRSLPLWLTQRQLMDVNNWYPHELTTHGYLRFSNFTTSAKFLFPCNGTITGMISHHFHSRD